MDKNETIAVGISGGVDSAVAAYLLKQQGYHVIGVTMQVWHGTGAEEHENVTAMKRDAEEVCRLIGIEHRMVTMESCFEDCVVKRFLSDYLRGRTPNPCVICNYAVKWRALREAADSVGATLVGTGHYAAIRELDNGRKAVAVGKDRSKDQTYMLYRLSQEQLNQTRMPLADYTKEEIRDLARSIGLSVADKSDSQEICFIPDDDYAGFLEMQAERFAMQMPPAEGNFVGTDGTVLGKHKGIWHYTVGQRKGLDIALGHPVYVVAIRPESNEVVLGNADEVFCRELIAGEVFCQGIGTVSEPISAVARIRYAHRGANCTVESAGDGLIRIRFTEPQRAVTPGQAVVVYDGDTVLLGATIEHAELSRTDTE